MGQGLLSVNDLWARRNGIRFEIEKFVVRANLNRPLRTRTVGGVGAGGSAFKAVEKVN